MLLFIGFGFTGELVIWQMCGIRNTKQQFWGIEGFLQTLSQWPKAETFAEMPCSNH